MSARRAFDTTDRLRRRLVESNGEQSILEASTAANHFTPCFQTNTNSASLAPLNTSHLGRVGRSEHPQLSRPPPFSLVQLRDSHWVRQNRPAHTGNSWRTKSDSAASDFSTRAMSSSLSWTAAAVEEFSIGHRIIMRMDDEVRLRFGSREFLEQELVRVARVSTNDERVSGGDCDE